MTSNSTDDRFGFFGFAFDLAFLVLRPAYAACIKESLSLIWVAGSTKISPESLSTMGSTAHIVGLSLVMGTVFVV